MRWLLLLFPITCFAGFITGTVSGLDAGKSFTLKSGKFSKTISTNGVYKINNGGALSITLQPVMQTCSILNTNITCVPVVVYVSTNLNWTQPTQNTDGSPLTDLTGFIVYYGTDPNLFTYSIKPVSMPYLYTTINNLTPNVTYYFAISSVSSSGEGPRSNIVYK